MTAYKWKCTRLARTAVGKLPDVRYTRTEFTSLLLHKMTTELYLSYPHRSKVTTHLLYVYCTAVKRQRTSSTSIDKYIYVHIYMCIFNIRVYVYSTFVYMYIYVFVDRRRGDALSLYVNIRIDKYIYVHIHIYVYSTFVNLYMLKSLWTRHSLLSTISS